jgi:hypothetical protein
MSKIDPRAAVGVHVQGRDARGLPQQVLCLHHHLVPGGVPTPQDGTVGVAADGDPEAIVWPKVLLVDALGETSEHDLKVRGLCRGAPAPILENLAIHLANVARVHGSSIVPQVDRRILVQPRVLGSGEEGVLWNVQVAFQKLLHELVADVQNVFVFPGGGHLVSHDPREVVSEREVLRHGREPQRPIVRRAEGAVLVAVLRHQLPVRIMPPSRVFVLHRVLHELDAEEGLLHELLGDQHVVVARHVGKPFLSRQLLECNDDGLVVVSLADGLVERGGRGGKRGLYGLVQKQLRTFHWENMRKNADLILNSYYVRGNNPSVEQVSQDDHLLHILGL